MEPRSGAGTGRVHEVEPAIARCVDPTLLILSEGRDVTVRDAAPAHVSRLVDDELAPAPVGRDVQAVPGRRGRPAVHVSAGDRAPAIGVSILVQGFLAHRARVTGHRLERFGAFAATPSEV